MINEANSQMLNLLTDVLHEQNPKEITMESAYKAFLIRTHLFQNINLNTIKFNHMYLPTT